MYLLKLINRYLLLYYVCYTRYLLSVTLADYHFPHLKCTVSGCEGVKRAY